jgi:peptidyl-tRNA hydrolase, PTH2 family
MTGESEFKQALIVRLDLGMGRGKIAVQCSHAAVSAAEEARTKFPSWYSAWVRGGQAKVALKIRELGLLMSLDSRARRLSLPAYLVRDRGLTQVPPGEITCLGIGPAPTSTLDSLTGELPLL